MSSTILQENELAFDIAFALPRSPIRGLRRAFTDDERRIIAKHVVEHVKLCCWRFELSTPVSRTAAVRLCRDPEPSTVISEPYSRLESIALRRSEVACQQRSESGQKPSV
jgi:hypothetical protein